MFSKIPTRDGNYQLKNIVAAAGDGSPDHPWHPVHAIDGPVPPTSVPVSFASIDAQTIIAAPGTGYRISVTYLKLFSIVRDFVVSLKSGANLIGYFGGAIDVANYIPPMKLNENEAFVLQSNVPDQIYGQVLFHIEEVA